MNREKEILVVSFGTSHRESRENALNAIEKDVAEAFSDYKVSSAFTSKVILNILKKEKITHIRHLEEAVLQALEEGVQSLYVQPTHFLDGNDYKKMKSSLESYKDRFSVLTIGAPLLDAPEDSETLAEAILEENREFLDGKTALCFVGHGVDPDSNQPYDALRSVLESRGFEDCYIGVMIAEPSKETVLQRIEAKGNYQRVVLVPLMIVAGAHAIDEMAGEEETSWRRTFENAGYEVECVLKGLGEYTQIRQIFVQHARNMIENENEE